MTEKINLGMDACSYPMPVTLVGANVHGRPSFMTVAWVSRVNFKPAIMAAALNKSHYATEGIRDNSTFSINIPSAEMIEVTDYCGIVSGRKAYKSVLFEVFYGEAKTAPMIKQCPLCIECKLLDIHELPQRMQSISERWLLLTLKKNTLQTTSQTSRK